MPRPFTVESTQGRVVFGIDATDALARELPALGADRLLVICGSGRDQDALRLVESIPLSFTEVSARALEHVPAEAVTDARRSVREARIDTVLAYGGGSSIGMGKAIALECDVRLVAVPTTYSGSEMTPVYGITEGGRKRTGRSERVRPALVVYDPKLTCDLPVTVSVTSGFNAIAHAVEALYAERVDPVTVHIAEEGIRELAESLPGIARDQANLEARSRALYGAYLCGIAIRAGMGLHHKLCHVLGGSFGLSHAGVHTVVLPHVVRFNAAASPEAAGRIAGALGASDPAAALFDLASRLGAPTSLATLGMRESDLPLCAELAFESPYPNPRPATKDDLLGLLQRAHAGLRP